MRLFEGTPNDGAGQKVAKKVLVRPSTGSGRRYKAMLSPALRESMPRLHTEFIEVLVTL